MKIVLGVLDAPHMEYLHGMPAKESDLMIGDLAEILESKYRIMQTFADMRKGEIAKAVKEAIALKIKAEIRGVKTPVNHLARAFGQIEHSFKDFIATQQMDGRVAGVPTMASLMGVNHRLKHPYASSNPVRPSFIDTGQYVASFKAWQP